MNRKLKLNKLTVSNLDRVKGGVEIPPCGCPYGHPEQGAYNLEHHSISCYLTCPNPGITFTC
jgi:hypothetical protein